MGADIGFLIKRELEYPGAAFYDILRYIGETNIPNGGVVPFLFDQTVRFLPNLLHVRQLTELELETTLYNFGNFYLQEKFNHRARQPKNVVKLLQILDFTEKATEKIKKKFKISDDDKAAADDAPPVMEDKYDTRTLTPPLVHIQPIKLSVNFDLNPSIAVDFISGQKCFMSPTTTIFEAQVMAPILKYVLQTQEKDAFQYKVAV